MLPGAGVYRAIGVIAAVLLTMSSAPAQDDAARMVDKFARDGERAETRKAQAAEAAKKKEDTQKPKQSEVRREAEAQLARALARRKAEEASAGETEMLARARREGQDLEVTAETRQLIEDAEAVRRRAEETLAHDAARPPQVGPPLHEPSAGFEKRLSPAEEDAERRARDVAAAKTRATEKARLSAQRAADHQHRIEAFARVHKVRSARLQARERRIAEEREAQRQSDVARASLARAAEARRSREALARGNKRRQQHAAARSRAVERAEAERQLALVLAADEARAEAQRTAAGPPSANSLGGEELRRGTFDHADNPPATRTTEQAQAQADRIVVAPATPLPSPEAGGEGRDDLTRRAPVETEPTRLAHERAAQVAENVQPPALRSDEHTTYPVTGVASKALGPPMIEEPGKHETWAPPARREVAGSEPHASGSDATSDWNGQVTVLLIMAPGNYGIRRGNRTADPILCTIEGCYLSTGPHAPALFLPGRKAIGIGNTFGRRAGACQHRLGCVFRGVAFDYPGMLQPVDLHILKHDRRRPEKVLADSNCAIAAGQLMCRRPVRGEGFIMWVLPDRLAERAGPELLERALYGGLDPLRSAEVGR